MAKLQERRLTDSELVIKALPSVLLQTLFFAVPLGMTIALTFQRSKDFQLAWTWDLATWTDVFTKSHYWKTLLHTVSLATLCVVLCVLIAFPVAYALATRLERWKVHVQILITFAFVTDAVLKTFGWVLFLDTSGALNWSLQQVGAPPNAVSILFTDWATMIGMVYNLLPFMIFTIYLSVQNIDRSLLLAAYDNGASKLRAFWEITLPLCRPGISAGAMLVFLLGMGVFLESKVLGGGKAPTSAELIRQTFETRVNWPLGAALTVVLMATAAAGLLLFARFYSIRRVGR